MEYFLMHPGRIFFGHSIDISSLLAGVCSSAVKEIPDRCKLICSAPFVENEVKEAIFQMHPTKAPGPDGLPALFYQKYWNIVGQDIVFVALDVLNNQRDPADLNSTFIALIPKIKNPRAPHDFRPISLCNVVMKAVTKSIANRLKEFLPEVVSEEQSAFVKGRLITDNALIAMDCFHWMKNKKAGKKGTMALKLDMSKAYDRIEWDFVVGALEAFGFPSNLVMLIRRWMLKHAANTKEIHGVKVARKAPTISHLFFADDSLIFSRANENEADIILKILEKYQRASGQMVNGDKSEVSFSSNLSTELKESIRNKLGFRAVGSHTKYLGLPFVFGRSKKEVFSMVVDRVWKKVKGWKESFLSKAGKEVLIKAVAQAIPTYVMSCYRIPDCVCNDIEVRIAEDNWIPTIAGFKPFSSRNLLAPNETVSKLIDSDLGRWKEEELRKNFTPFEAVHIASIPISARLPEDSIIWHFEKDGEYSVKSAYHLSRRLHLSSRAGTSSNSEGALWKNLWKAPLIERTKNFTWRLLNNILPTKCNLEKKGIKLDVSCPFCHNFPESTNHVFMYCEFAKRVFFSPPLGVRLPQTGDLITWLMEMIKKKDWKLAQVVCTGLWKIWNARNAVVFKSDTPKPHQIAQTIGDAIMEINKAKDCDTNQTHDIPMSITATGHWTVNVDAGCFEDGVVSLGCLIKVPKAGTYMAACKTLSSFAEPSTAELLGIKWAMEVAKDLQIENVMFYSDALDIVDSINGVVHNATLDFIVNDCKALLYSFRDAALIFISRNLNTEAHHMVDVGKALGSNSWFGHFPTSEELSVPLASLASV
ncbi:uncharacterized protein LOC131657739 [Vicia villosa]|uniref:uncharacterized protein LOC131657739 n=1 Tax=Vicia villosa TaxID=3911 RepID=UPI00273B3921|nr:uncharacterized protein LOC131657739 [Vicia villosa]